jgi:hypothetical protein
LENVFVNQLLDTIAQSKKISLSTNVQIKIDIFYFDFHHPFNLVRGSVLLSSDLSSLSIAVERDHEPWFSLSNSALIHIFIIITTVPTDDWDN